MSFGRANLVAVATALSLSIASQPACAATPARLLAPRAKASLLADADAGLSPGDRARFAALLKHGSRAAEANVFDYLELLPQNQRAEFAAYLVAERPTERTVTIRNIAMTIDGLRERAADRAANEQRMPPEYRALRQQRPRPVILDEVDAQLSPAEVAQFRALLERNPPATRAALIDFTGEFADVTFDSKTGRYSLRTDGEGAFVAALLDETPREQANIIGFISRLNSGQRRGAAGIIATDDSRGHDQWANFFLYLGSTPPRRSFLALFPVDPMQRMFATQDGWSTDQPLWIRPGEDGDLDACRSASKAGDAARTAKACKWGFERPGVGVSNGQEAPDTPWQVEIYRVGDAASSRFNSADLKSEQLNYGAVRADQDRDEACGGVLIPGNWVVTAAHCVQIDGKPVDWVLRTRRARTGTKSLLSGGTTWKIAGAIVHAGYDPDLNRNDIALLKIEADGETRPDDNWQAHPIDLPPANAPVPDGTPLMLTGWGMTGEMAIDSLRDVHGHARTKSLKLLAATLTKVPLSQCQENENYRREDYKLGPGEICALGQRNQDACEGDSGGPLVHRVHGWARLVGIVSFGPGCGLDNTGSIYTDIAYFRGWIDQAMKNLNPGQVSKWPPS